MFNNRQPDWPDQTLKQSLAPLAALVRRRYRLETVRLTLTWGLAAAAGALVFLKLTPFSAFLFLAGIPGATAAIFIFIFRRLSFPGALEIVRIADELGLNARAITAYRLAEKNSRDPWNRAAIEEGIKACRELECKETYPVLPSRRSWQGILFLAGVLLTTILLPAPLASHWQAGRAEKEALAAAAFQAEEAAAPLRQMSPEQKEFLPEKLQEDLNDLSRAVSRAKDRQEAARNLERAGQEMEDALASLEPSERSLRQLTGVWKQSREPLLQKIAAALEKGNLEETVRLAGELHELAQSAGPGKNELALSIFQAAEATGDPVLREDLRRLAGSLLSPGGDENAKEGSESPGHESLSRALSSLGQKATAARRLAQASPAMFNLANTLASGGQAQDIALAGSGLNTKSSGNNGLPGEAAGSSPGAGATGSNPGAYPGAAGSNGAGSTGSASGSPSGLGADGNFAGGAGNSGSAGNGPGNGAGEGQGNGGSGNGDGGGGGNNGSGAGTGGGGSGAGGRGAGMSGGGPDRIYAPHLLGGSGQETHVSGRIGPGQGGTETSLPESPTELGAVRPYREVLPLYREEAINSLSAAPLPPDLESLVWQYFTSLD